MLARILSIFASVFILVSPVSACANTHAGDGVKFFEVSTQKEDDIFGEPGDIIEYKVFTETDNVSQGEFVAGAYVYNDSLTNGDCVEMNIIIVEYSQSGSNRVFDSIQVKTIHACPGDNGKFVYTDNIMLDASTTIVKAMIWGKEKIIPYALSADYEK